MYLLKATILPQSYWRRFQDDSKDDLQYLIAQFKDAKELGSIIKIDRDYDFDKLRNAVNDVSVSGIDLYGIQESKETILKVIDLAEYMSTKYEAVVTNPRT
jgi:hypothetical protein